MGDTPVRAIKERKKVPFLKAFVRLGSISSAAKAVRISRDAVHDWRGNDPAFAASFLVAKSQARDCRVKTALNTLNFFLSVAKRFVAPDTWPKLLSELHVQSVNEFVSDHTVAPSRKTVRAFPSTTTLGSQDLSSLDGRRSHR